MRISFGAVVLAMGCRERTRANLMIPGSRPSGIYTAGSAQKLINLYGHKVGKKVVILGSGDIGMIMARRLTMEGAKVEAVVELMPFLAGLQRNKVQCLDDFEIPLLLSHTVVDITGVDRLESVTIAPVDEKKQPIMEEAKVVECDTLLLSVGLIPENELSRTGGVALSEITKGAVVNQFKQTSVPYIFACGNVLHVHDLVDYVSEEAALAGKNAAVYIQGKNEETEGSCKEIALKAENGVRYTVPQSIESSTMSEKLTVRFRVADVYKNRSICVYYDGKLISQKKKRVLAPGEMEQVVLLKSSLEEYPDLKEITIRTEEES